MFTVRSLSLSVDRACPGAWAVLLLRGHTSTGHSTGEASGDTADQSPDLQ